ncbi:MAG: hypothetical protein LBP21_06715 [Synergistaceae bacterium]|nr:hypothetical protein [Synergistaceae bacterium]
MPKKMSKEERSKEKLKERSNKERLRKDEGKDEARPQPALRKYSIYPEEQPEIVRALLAKNLPLEFIREATGLTDNEILSLR